MLFIPEGEHSNSGSPGENKNNKKGTGIGPRIIRPALTSKENDNNNLRLLDSKQKKHQYLRIKKHIVTGQNQGRKRCDNGTIREKKSFQKILFSENTTSQTDPS